ncbi:hypothetical protein AKJ16_DCAP27360, partial [Drosera capensis]
MISTNPALVKAGSTRSFVQAIETQTNITLSNPTVPSPPMAGLLAWAADVVGRRSASASGTDSDSPSSIPLIFTPEQDNYARDLDSRASSLARSIQDLRARIPPSGIAERLPELHAHSVASNAELVSQLNAHSTTREQAQQREIKLQEENAAFERLISDCESKIQERLLEACSLQEKLK